MKREELAAVFFAAAIVLGFAASAGAVDGTIEINQAKVAAAGGFPYKITTGGSYRLTGNLTVASGNGINVTAPNVTIDLNGFSITGPATSSSATPIGINAAGENEITVENGVVTGFGTGVSVGDADIVRNIHADVNFNGIEVGNFGVVSGSTANNANAGATGIECAMSCVITSNTANGNSAGGITCGAPGEGNACVISGNTVTDDGVGIHCTGEGCLITGNTVSDNNTGIEASDTTTGFGGNILFGNTANFSSGHSFGTNLCTGSTC